VTKNDHTNFIELNTVWSVYDYNIIHVHVKIPQPILHFNLEN